MELLLLLILFSNCHRLVLAQGSSAGLPDQIQRVARKPGCTCLRSTLHNHLCRNDFVIKAKIIDDENAGGSYQTLRGYQILVKDVFHLPYRDALKPGNRVALYTPAQTDFCGARFVRRQMYLIAGRIVENYLIVTSCDFYRKWHTITPVMEQNLAVLPKKRHCECVISGCSGEVCASQHESAIFSAFETSKCRLNTLAERCYEDYGQCRKNNRGKCEWRNERKAKQCLNASRRLRLRKRLLKDVS